MQVVHFLNAIDGENHAGDFLDVQLGWASFQQNMRGFPEDADGGPQNQNADGKTEKGIEPFATRAQIEQGILKGRNLELLYCADPVDVFVQRWIDAMPQYGPGHADVVAELRAGVPPTIAVAGSYLDGIGVPACIGAATRAATRAIRALGALKPEVAR